MKKLKVIILFSVIAVMIFLCGCENTNGGATSENKEPMYKTMEELRGKTVATISGSAQEKMAIEKFPDSEILYYPTFSECFLAVRQGKADFTIAPNTAFSGVSESFSTLVRQDEPISTTDAFFGMSKSEFGTQLQMQMTEFLNERWEAGEQEKMLDCYFSDPQYGELYDFSTLSGENGTVEFAIIALDAPYFRVIDNKYKGIEAELLYLFCEKYGYAINVSITEFGSVLLGISTDKYNLTAYLVYTQERAEKMLFSSKYMVCDQIVIVQTRGGNTNSINGILGSIASGFEKNFLRENRWKMVVSGLWVTIKLALGSAFFGTLFGFILCLVRMGKSKIMRKIAAVFIRIIQGIPILVLLLVLYYIVFAKSTISGIVVGIFAFSIDFGVYVAEILRAAIDAVPVGQWEASSALGFSKAGSYVFVVFPQALKHAMPVYKGQFITMVKMTSIIGYVAVQDLTKVSDIIRTRTYDAFFPLISTALIYFLLSWVLVWFLDKIEIKTNPSRRKKILSDVNKNVELTEKEDSTNYQDNKDVIIRIHGLRKEYDSVIPLENVNCEIRRGDVIAVIGPSGTGKSTLLRCINRMEKPTSGSVELLGVVSSNAKAMNQLRMRVGMVFQSFNLFDHLTVIENIMLAPVKLKKVSRQNAFEYGMVLLHRVGLADKAFSYPNELSGGQKQRVAIVRALAMNPEILLLDEPTSALDPTMVSEVLQVITQLSKSGLTMMIVTHEMHFARKVSNRVFYMDEGRIYEDGETKQVFENPVGERTRLFIQRMKLYRQKIEGPNIDYLAIRNKLESFCEGQLMSHRESFNLLHCVEEILTQGVTTLNNSCFPAEIAVEYSQDNSLIATIRYGGESVNIISLLDSVSDSIVQSTVSRIAHAWTVEEGNTLTLRINN